MAVKAKDLIPGTMVRFLFRKNNNHNVTGRISTVNVDQYHLPGTWVQIVVCSWDEDNPQVLEMIKFGHYNVLVPIEDVLEILLPEKQKDVMRPIINYEIVLVNTHTGMTWTYYRKDLFRVRELIDWAIDRGLSVKSVRGLSR